MVRSILQRLSNRIQPTNAKPPTVLANSTNILDAYVNSAPSKQNILDIFEGEWSSRMPEEYNLQTQPGFADVFEHALIVWAEETLGSFNNQKVLELGPLEGGHSYMLHKSGAAKVVSIEANTRAFLKCLCIKEVLNLTSVEFHLGDFMLYLQDCEEAYDTAIASGVLYHMMDPVSLLQRLSAVSDKLLLWTHYYDAEILIPNEQNQKRFGEIQSASYEGFAYEFVSQSYNDSLDWVGFSGGPRPQSRWLTRASLMSALEFFGYSDLQIGFDHQDHPNGPAIGICARR